MTPRLSVVGLGKLGACMAAAFASRGFPVVGVDVDAEVVRRMNDGLAPVEEPDLAAYIAAHRSRLRATTSHDEAVREADVTFVIVPTPSDAQGAFALEQATSAIDAVGRALATKTDYHLVVLTSTVLPGACRHALLPALERASGKQVGRDVGLCYSPEFIALGSVIRDFLNPDVTLIGEVDARSGDVLEALYARALCNRPPCRRMSLENAELCKLALNTYVTTKITFANMLADLCQRLPGGDVDVVTDALGADSRVARKYLTGALGFGGPCFPRDNRALAYVAAALGLDAPLPDAVDRANDTRPADIAALVRDTLPAGATVAVLGLAYKPCTHIVEASQALAIAQLLVQAGYRVVAWDPLVASLPCGGVSAPLLLGSADACLREAHAVVIATPDPAFDTLAPASFAGTGAAPRLVVDCWRRRRRELESQPGVRYVAVGLSREDEANHARLAALWTAAT